MFVEQLVARLLLAASGREPIHWTHEARERGIVEEIAALIERILDGPPPEAPERVAELSFWIFSLCRHGHWNRDLPEHLFLEMLSTEAQDLALCTGLLSIGVPLGGDWPNPWPDLRDEHEEAPLIALLEADRARLEALCRAIREDKPLSLCLRTIARRLREAVTINHRM